RQIELHDGGDHGTSCSACARLSRRRRHAARAPAACSVCGLLAVEPRHYDRVPPIPQEATMTHVGGFLVGALVLAATPGRAQAPALAAPAPRFLNPSGIGAPRGYSHVVEVTGPGRTIYIAGQLGYDPSGQVPAPGDFRAQAMQVFENLKTALGSVCG